MNFELGNLIHTMDESLLVSIETVGNYYVAVWSYNTKFIPAKIVKSNQIRFLYITEEDRKHTRISFDTKEECVNFLNTIILMEL